MAKGRLSEQWLGHIARRRGRAGCSREQAIRLGEARRLAVAIRTAAAELVANKTQLQTLVNILAPQLLAKTGVGPVSAAQALVTFSHPGRCRNDAAFAAFAGASPIQASSGRIKRHRLNRGGDRAMNRALHDITLNRWRVCPRTHNYIEKRRAEGKSDPEIRRALKRYIARELFKSLNQRTSA